MWCSKQKRGQTSIEDVEIIEGKLPRILFHTQVWFISELKHRNLCDNLGFRRAQGRRSQWSIFMLLLSCSQARLVDQFYQVKSISKQTSMQVTREILDIKKHIINPTDFILSKSRHLGVPRYKDRAFSVQL